MKGTGKPGRKRLCVALLALMVSTGAVHGAWGRYVWSGTVGSFSLTVQSPQAGLQAQAAWTAAPHLCVEPVGTNQLRLTAEAGYTLPSVLSVQVDGAVYTVYPAALEQAQGVSFDAATGLLSLPVDLTLAASVSVTGDAVPVDASNTAPPNGMLGMAPAPMATATDLLEVTSTPTAEPEPDATAVPDPTATAEPDPTATAAPGPNATAEPEPTATAEPEPNATAEPEPDATAEPEPNATAEPDPTTTPVPEPDATAEPEPTATAEPEATATAEPEPDATAVPDPTATAEPEPDATAEPDPTATAAPEPNATAEPEPDATAVPDPTVTAAPEPAATATPEPTPQIREVDWNLKLTHLEEKEPQKQWNALQLTLEPGYMLPETIKVEMGGTEYIVNTNGKENEDGVTFIPGECKLVILPELLQACGGKVRVTADAVPVPVPESDITAEPATPEPATPEPATPEPATPEPATPEPATLEPATPEPATLEPATPEPATPEPATPEPATPAPEEQPIPPA